MFSKASTDSSTVDVEVGVDAGEHLEFGDEAPEVFKVEVGRLVDELLEAAGEGSVECLPRERCLVIHWRSVPSR